MHRTFAHLTLLWLGAVCTLTARGEPLVTTPLPADAIARQPAITSVALSPDGQHVASIIASADYKWPVMAVWRADSPTTAPVLIPSRDTRPISISFIGDRRLVFTVDHPVGQNLFAGRWQRTVFTDLTGSSFDYPFRPIAKETLDRDTVETREGGYGAFMRIIQAGNFEHPNVYTVALRPTRSADVTIYTLDADTLKVEKLARAPKDESLSVGATYLIADIRDGRLLVRRNVRNTSDGWTTYHEIYDREAERWEEHPELGALVKARREIKPLGFFDPDPNKLFVLAKRGSNFAALWIYDVATRAWEPEAAISSPEADIAGGSPALDWTTKKTLGFGSFEIRRDAQLETFVDGKLAAAQAAIEPRFPGQRVSFTERDRSWGNAIVTVSGPKQPPVYYLWRNGRELIQLGKSRPWIDSQTLGEATRRSFKARDGLIIPAFVTLPPGYQPAKHGRIPLVILPHDGPWDRDDLDWHEMGWPQFLATRGYAVLQPQYRGSKGWGDALWRAGDKQWGLKMQDDLDDAAAWLIGEGTADPARVAIMGYHHGGYAAVVATQRPNGFYRCAIAGAPTTRLRNREGGTGYFHEAEGWTIFGVDPSSGIDNAAIPLMLFHGTNDTQVDIERSRDFRNAMTRANKDIEYHEIKNMWHELPWWPEWHRESLGLIENYLKGPKCFGDK